MDNQEKNQETKDLIFFPMLVDNNFGIKDTPEEVMQRWDFFNALSEEEKDRMLAQSVPSVLKDIAERCSLSDEDAACLTRLVRDLFFKVVSEDKIEIELQNRIPKLVDAQLRDVAKLIMRNILTTDVEQIRKAANNAVNLSVASALVQFPNVAEQVISSMPLKLRISPNPVKPSVKNWIADYREQMGMGKHGTFDRGNFLFHGENSKRLTSVERQKLSAILKSLDDETPLSINPDKQEIIFENLQTDERMSQVVAPVEAKPQPNAAIQSNMQSANTASQTPKQSFMQAVQSRPMASPAVSLKSSGINQFTVRGALPQVTSTNIQPNIDGMKQDLTGAGRGITSITDKKMPTFERKGNAFSKVQATVGDMTINSGFQKPAMAPVAQPVRKETLQHMNLETGEKIDNYFGVQSAGAKMESFPKQAPAPKKEFENKSPNFSQLLKAQTEPAKKVADEDAKKKPAVAPVPAQQKPIAGKVIFSSPQQLSVEKRAVPKRSPYRITPREEQ